MQPLALAFGVNYFFYWYVSYDQKSCAIGTNDELIQEYFDQSFYLQHPLFCHVRQVKTGIYIYDDVRSDEFQSSFHYLEKRYDAKHRAMLARKDDHGVHIYGFSIPSQREDAPYLYISEKKALWQFARYFEGEFNKTLHSLHDNMMDLKPKARAIGRGIKIPEIQLPRERLQQFLRQVLPTSEQLDFYDFTVRELECIKEFLNGKTAREIAQALHLSNRTIEHRLDNLKDKLDCNSRSELFCKLLKIKEYYPDCFNEL